MRVAITGGTGFVGRHLAQALTAEGHEVVLTARGVDRRIRLRGHSLHTFPVFEEQICKGLPAPGPFGIRDLRCCQATHPPTCGSSPA